MSRMNVFVLIVVLLIITAGCTDDDHEIVYEADSAIEGTIKVLYYDDQAFFREYGDLFLAKFPNLEVEVVEGSLQGSGWERILEEEKPDVLALDMRAYDRLIQEGRLYELDPLMAHSEFDLEQVHSGIVQFLRQIGEGKLYGLPPTFINKAVYYNAELFDAYGIPYPQDHMTWQELLELAARFPANEEIYGLYVPRFVLLLEEMGYTEGVTFVDSDEMKVTIQDGTFHEILKQILDGYRAGAIVSPDFSETLEGPSDPFISGKSAMMFNYSYYIHNELGRFTGEKQPFRWDLTASPVHANNRQASTTYYFNYIFAVNAESEQVQASWELVKWINSKEAANLKSKASQLELPTRTSYLYNPEGKHMEAFYTLDPDFHHMLVEYDRFPKGFFGQLEAMILQESKMAYVGQKSLDEALQSIQTRGETELRMLRQN
ncbi:ABC transporter substrate-binding protein [Marinicrinis lubricantis]|uniref:ABC transporter substrate-binding protein n=1 Tax=Marinicrinis lubricantis TaxID=2086470 RepID=A0ABW1IKB8_9BACL